MQTIQLTVNGVVKAQGGIEVSNPLIKVGVGGVDLTGENAIFSYFFSMYTSQAEMDAENPFVPELFSTQKPMNKNAVVSGRISGADFSAESDSNFNLTSASLDSFKAKVIEHLAGALEMDASNIA
jgi:hypothetical protein